MIVINLFGPPGAGKSTGAASIFSELKMKGINAELITEFAKDKVYEETKEVWNNQQYIFGKQSFRLGRLRDKVEVVVTDAPIPLSAYYNNDPILGEHFNEVVKNVFNSYNNINFFVQRVKKYNPLGRFQTEEESDIISEELIKFLTNNKILFSTIEGNKEGYNTIVEEILKLLK